MARRNGLAQMRIAVGWLPIALAWLIVPSAPATAGGGCHAGMTHGTGDTVLMREACFTPGILQVEPGTSVTFSNEDPMTHNVSANGWGYLDPMERGDRFHATFEAPGVYPFACTYHPGMTGAIVVGDGTGAGNGELVSVTSLEPPGPGIRVRTVTEPASSSAVAIGWGLGGAIGLAIGLATGALAHRARRAAA